MARVERRCVLSIIRESKAGTGCIMFRGHQMSRTSEHGNSKRKEAESSGAKVVAKGGEPQQLLVRVPPTAGASSVSTATFSSMSKQAESLVSGGNSVVFNPYNNNLVFQWIAMNMNDCISIDTMKRAIANIANIQFTSGGTMTGISDGFIVDDRGQIVQLYDPTIALSCAFGYKIQTESTETSTRLDVEIERRQLDFSQLLMKYQETDRNAMHAESMIHYIDFNLTDHVMTFRIPVEDEMGTLSHGDMLPAETMEYGAIVPGRYDPHVGIDEVEMVGFTSRDVVTVDRDGIAVDGTVRVSGDVVCGGVADVAAIVPSGGVVRCGGSLTVDGDVVAQSDVTVNKNIAAMGYVYGNGGIGFPEYSVTVEDPEGGAEPVTITFPEMLVVGVAQTFDVVSVDLVPSSQAVNDLIKAMMTTHTHTHTHCARPLRSALRACLGLRGR